MTAVRSGAPTTVPVEDLLLLLTNVFSKDSIAMECLIPSLTLAFTLSIWLETVKRWRMKGLFKKL